MPSRKTGRNDRAAVAVAQILADLAIVNPVLAAFFGGFLILTSPTFRYERMA